MGSVCECIRAGGSGLGGVLTQVGLGTEVENGRQKITLDGKEYLIMPPIKGKRCIT